MASTSTNKQPLMQDRVLHQVVDGLLALRLKRLAVLILLALTLQLSFLTALKMMVQSLVRSTLSAVQHKRLTAEAGVCIWSTCQRLP